MKSDNGRASKWYRNSPFQKRKEKSVKSDNGRASKWYMNSTFQKIKTKVWKVIMVELLNDIGIHLSRKEKKKVWKVIMVELLQEFQLFRKESVKVWKVIMVELASRRAPLFRGSGWETRPGLAVAFPNTQNKVRASFFWFLVVGPSLYGYLIPNTKLIQTWPGRLGQLLFAPCSCC